MAFNVHKGMLRVEMFLFEGSRGTFLDTSMTCPPALLPGMKKIGNLNKCMLGNIQGIAFYGGICSIQITVGTRLVNWMN